MQALLQKVSSNYTLLGDMPIEFIGKNFVHFSIDFIGNFQ